MTDAPAVQPLGRDEWDQFCADAMRQMDVTRRDRIWWDGEFIDRSFLFLFRGGQLVGASEQFSTTTGAPPRPLADPQSALADIAAARINFPRAIQDGSIRYPRINAQVTNWLMPHVICLEVNYVTTDRATLDGPKPAEAVGMERFDALVRALRTGLPRFLGMEDGFQRARFLQPVFSAGIEDGVVSEVRELGPGGQPDLVYWDTEAVWQRLVSCDTNPMPMFLEGRYGGDALLQYRVLRHGTMGHCGLFIRPAGRISA